MFLKEIHEALTLIPEFRWAVFLGKSCPECKRHDSIKIQALPNKRVWIEGYGGAPALARAAAYLRRHDVKSWKFLNRSSAEKPEDV